MSRGRKVLLGLVALVVVLAGAIAWYLGPIAPIATGYAAKTACSAVFVSGRTLEDGLGDLPGNPLVPLLRTDLDESEGTVRTSLLGLWPSTAYATEGLGCALAEQRPDLAPPTTRAERGDPDAPWPHGEAPVAEDLDGVDVETLELAIDTTFTEDDPEGRRRNTRAVVVVHDGQLVAERYGDGFDVDTPLLGWSMGKSMANAVVGRLVAEGQLDVEDRDLRAEWRGDERAEITVGQLLTMTSGLVFEEVYDPDTDATRMLFRPGDTGAYAADQPLAAEPGTRWSYSSGTTNILCDVAQEASGLGVDLAHELLFAPLGMASATIEADASGGLVCSSFPYATARDWARFGQLYLQDGEWDGERLLPDGWVEDTMTPVDLADPDTPYGAHWWLNEGPEGQLRMASVPADASWASGNEGQQVVVIPSQDLVVVRLGFSGEFSGVEWGLEPLLAGVIDALEAG